MEQAEAQLKREKENGKLDEEEIQNLARNLDTIKNKYEKMDDFSKHFLERWKASKIEEAKLTPGGLVERRAQEYCEYSGFKYVQSWTTKEIPYDKDHPAQAYVFRHQATAFESSPVHSEVYQRETGKSEGRGAMVQSKYGLVPEELTAAYETSDLSEKDRAEYAVPGNLVFDSIVCSPIYQPQKTDYAMLYGNGSPPLLAWSSDSRAFKGSKDEQIEREVEAVASRICEIHGHLPGALSYETEESWETEVFQLEHDWLPIESNDLRAPWKFSAVGKNPVGTKLKEMKKSHPILSRAFLPVAAVVAAVKAYPDRGLSTEQMIVRKHTGKSLFEIERKKKKGLVPHLVFSSLTCKDRADEDQSLKDLPTVAVRAVKDASGGVAPQEMVDGSGSSGKVAVSGK